MSSQNTTVNKPRQSKQLKQAQALSSVGKVSLRASCVWASLLSDWAKHGCFPLCQRLWKFRSELKLKDPFRFLPMGIFGITSGGISPISVGKFRPKFADPFLANRFFALIREFGKRVKCGKSHSYWLTRINWKMSFHFRRVLALFSDRSVCHKLKSKNMRLRRFWRHYLYPKDGNDAYSSNKDSNANLITKWVNWW